MNLRKLLPKVLQSTVVIIAQGPDGSVGSIGSGVIVAPEKVVTCNHVVSPFFGKVAIAAGLDAGYDAASDSIGAEFATAKYSIEALDLALLHVPKLKGAACRFRSTDGEQGEEAFWVGHPQPLGMQAAPLVSKGIVAGPTKILPYPGGPTQNVAGLRLDGTVLPGNSGGGVFDEDGRVIGIECAAPLLLRHPHLRELLQAKNDSVALISGVNVVEQLQKLMAELETAGVGSSGFAIKASVVSAVLPNMLAGIIPYIR